MGEFKVISTQEELDALIKDRIDRERKSLSEKYSDYEELKKRNTEYEAQVSKLSEANKAYEAKAAEYDKQINELSSKVKGYETDSAKTRIALEAGLPYEMAGRLSGSTEEEIRKDAEILAKFVSKKESAPIGSNEPAKYNKSQDDALRSLVRNMSTE
ncbi:MAG: DUF4355 domain-containing protein [Erysipelotrichaceae bacterium]|nr:DUF4355 domain-containing protein [Erysipelotrichaceae bacterium]